MGSDRPAVTASAAARSAPQSRRSPDSGRTAWRIATPNGVERDAFASLVRGNTELVPLGELGGRVSAAACLLYPPGIPVVVPGERFDAQERPIIDYLELLQRWDSRFPGFEAEVQGVVCERSADGARALPGELRCQLAISCPRHHY